MSWQQAVEIFAGHPGYARLKILCADDNTDAWQRDGYRVLVMRLASGVDGESQPDPTVHDPRSTVHDETLQAYLTAHPCGGCH